MKFIKFLRIVFFVNLQISLGPHLMPFHAKIIVLASTKTKIANICEVHNDFSQLRDYIAFTLCSKNIKCNQIQVCYTWMNALYINIWQS